MANHELTILNANCAPDSSGKVFFAPLETVLSLGTATFGTTLGCVMGFPTGSDVGIYGKFTIPRNYVGTPVLVIRGVLDGTPANVLGFGLQQTGGIADSEAVDIAYEAEDVASNSTWTGYADEDMYEETIAITPTSAYAIGDEVFFFFYRDDSVDTQTTDFILTGLAFRFADA